MVYEFPIWATNIPDRINYLKNNISNITHIIVMGQHDLDIGETAYKQYLPNIVEIAKTNNVPMDIITMAHPNIGISFNDPYVKIHYWPEYWFLETRKRMTSGDSYKFNKSLGLNFNDTNSILSHTDFKYLFISLNKIQKTHRCIMIDMLAKNNLIDKGAIAWRSIPRCKGELVGSSTYRFKYRKNTPLFLDQTSDQKLFNQEQLPIQYSQSFMQIVPESTDKFFAITEKTCVPLFFCKPFLVVGCHRFHTFLQDLGFQLYDELFDYYFDGTRDIEKRYDLISREIKKFESKNPKELKQIYITIKDKLLYNREHAFKLSEKYLEIWDLTSDRIRF